MVTWSLTLSMFTCTLVLVLIHILVLIIKEKFKQNLQNELFTIQESIRFLDHHHYTLCLFFFFFCCFECKLLCNLSWEVTSTQGRSWSETWKRCLHASVVQFLFECSSLDSSEPGSRLLQVFCNQNMMFTFSEDDQDTLKAQSYLGC